MTREEAIEQIKLARAEVEWNYPISYAAAFDLAIEALDQPEVVFCKDCERHNHNDWDFPQDEVCPLVSYRGKAQAHEFDYQYCVCGRKVEA